MIVDCIVAETAAGFFIAQYPGQVPMTLLVFPGLALLSVECNTRRLSIGPLSVELRGARFRG